MGLADREYGVITLHRPSNVDDPATLSRLVRLFLDLARDLPLVFAVHPRTIARGGAKWASPTSLRRARTRLICLGPQPYLDTISLVSGAAVVLTDSGGLQEETSVLGVPCLTLRENTERPITVRLGTSRLVGNESEKIRGGIADVVNGRWPAGGDIPLWDGRSGSRVVAALKECLR